MSDILMTAEKLKDARSSVRGLYREKYQETVAPYMEAIKRRMARTNEGALEAAINMAAASCHAGIRVLLILAAGVELVAPVDQIL